MLERCEGPKIILIAGIYCANHVLSSACIFLFSQHYFFLFLIKCIGMTLVNKMLQVSSVHFYDPSPVCCIVCPPPKIKSLFLGPDLGGNSGGMSLGVCRCQICPVSNSRQSSCDSRFSKIIFFSNRNSLSLKKYLSTS